MFRLDVAVVGFVVFAVIGPLFGGYLGAWLIDSSGSAAMVAVLAGGTDGAAIGAAAGAAVALVLTLRFMAGPVLDSFVGAWPENQFLATHPAGRLLTAGYRARNDEADAVELEGPLGLGGAAGWLGSAFGGALLAGMSLSAWPAVDAGVIDRVGANGASALDWLVAAFPVVARTIVGSILGILVGAVWSIFGGPVARMEALEEDLERELDSRVIVDAPPPASGEAEGRR